MNQADKKKVGILTLPLNENFGGILQTVALYGFLTEQGFEVVHLRNEYFRSQWRAVFRKLLERIPFQNMRGARYEYSKKKLHEVFLKKHLPNRTRTLSSVTDFKKIAQKEKFDAVIVGSDQVWRWDYIIDGYHRYFLDFVQGSKTRKIAYAASFGKPYWQAAEKKAEITELLSDFHAVSTRESDGIDICHQFGRQECQLVVDPTLLVGRIFYNDLLEKDVHSTSKKTLLTYVLDRQSKKLKFITHVHQKLGLGDVEAKSLGLQSKIRVSEWLTAFHNADYVITDSFHGMVFSILFNKQFIAIGNSNRGVSRFTSLLNQLGIVARMVDENRLTEEVANELVIHKINYEEIESKLQLLRASSASFLLKALS